MTDWDFLRPEAPPGPALRPVPVSPGPPPTLLPGCEYILSDGDYSTWRLVGVKATAEKPIRIRAQNKHKARFRGGHYREGGLYFSLCQHIEVIGCGFGPTAQNGLRAVDSRFLAVRDGHFAGMRLNGILTGFCSDLEITGCEMDGTAQAADGNLTPHLIYVSCSAARVLIAGNRLTRAHGAAVQLNGNATLHSEAGSPFTGWVEAATLLNNQALNCGRGGAAGANLPRVRASKLQNCLFAWEDSWSGPEDQAGGIACYEGTHDVDIEQCTVRFPPGRGRYGVQGPNTARVAASIIACGRGRNLDGAVSVDSASKVGTPAQAQNWIDPATFKSKIPGIGWSG